MKFTKIIIATLAIASLSTFADDSLSVLALQRANFSLEQAVEKVSSEYEGHIVEFEIENENENYKNKVAYDIEIINLKSEKRYKIQLSLEDGRVLKEINKSIKVLEENHLDDDELLTIQELQALNFKLSSTISTLEQTYSAHIIEFELESEKGINFYKFKLMNEQGTKHVIADIETGSITPMMKH